jgi:hypothetical protein
MLPSAPRRKDIIISGAAIFSLDHATKSRLHHAGRLSPSAFMCAHDKTGAMFASPQRGVPLCEA